VDEQMYAASAPFLEMQSNAAKRRIFKKTSLDEMVLLCNINSRDSWIFFDQTFLGLELGTLFLARESLVSDIPAGDGNISKLFRSSKL